MVWTFTALSLGVGETQLRPYDDGYAVFNVAKSHWCFARLVHLQTGDLPRKNKLVDLIGRRMPLIPVDPNGWTTASRTIGENGRKLLCPNRCAASVMVDANSRDGTHHVRYVLRIAFGDVVCGEKSAISVPLARAETDFVQHIIAARRHENRIELVDHRAQRHAHLDRLARSNIDRGASGLEAYVADDQQLCPDAHAIESEVAVLVRENCAAPHRHFNARILHRAVVEGKNFAANDPGDRCRYARRGDGQILEC